MDLPQTAKAHNAIIALTEFYTDVAMENARLREHIAQLEAALKRAALDRAARHETTRAGGG